MWFWAAYLFHQLSISTFYSKILWRSTQSFYYWNERLRNGRSFLISYLLQKLNYLLFLFSFFSSIFSFLISFFKFHLISHHMIEINQWKGERIWTNFQVFETRKWWWENLILPYQNLFLFQLIKSFLSLKK